MWFSNSRTVRPSEARRKSLVHILKCETCFSFPFHVYLEMFKCLMWHSSLKVRPACNWSCPASQRSVQHCQQWVSTGCQHCHCCFLAWFCPSKLHREETMELSEVPVQLLGLLTRCSSRQSLLWIYCVFFRNLMSDLQIAVSNSTFNMYQGVSLVLFLTAGKEFSLSVKMLDEFLF